jgi:hypothetical protein
MFDDRINQLPIFSPLQTGQQAAACRGKEIKCMINLWKKSLYEGVVPGRTSDRR